MLAIGVDGNDAAINRKGWVEVEIAQMRLYRDGFEAYEWERVSDVVRWCVVVCCGAEEVEEKKNSA